MTVNSKPNPKQVLKSATIILVIDWPDAGVPRTLLNAGFTVFSYSPGGYSQAMIVAELPEGFDKKNSFPPRNQEEKGYLIFQGLDHSPGAIDIVNVYRPEEELPGIITNNVLPFGAKVLWLHPLVTSARAKDIAAENGILFIEGTNIAEVASEIGAETTFIPVLSVKSGVIAIDFYKNAFGAIQLWRLNNDDGSVHVAAFSINGAIFRLHEEGARSLSPAKAGSTTVTVALTVDDVHAVMAQAMAAGAIELSPVTDYPYGYRQGDLQDPFGHLWTIEKLMDKGALGQFIKQQG